MEARQIVGFDTSAINRLADDAERGDVGRQITGPISR